MKRFTVEGKDFYIHLNPDKPHIPTYIGKVITQTSDYGALFGFQDWATPAFILRDIDQLRTPRDTRIPPYTLYLAHREVADADIAPDFLLENDNIRWPNGARGKIIGQRYSPTAYYAALQPRDQFNAFCGMIGARILPEMERPNEIIPLSGRIPPPRFAPESW